MPKHRERNSDEWYKAEIRSLKKQIRSLQKQLKQYEKISHLFEESQDEEISTDSEDTILKKKFCGSCGKGILETVDIVGRIFEICPVCKDRKKI